MADIVLLGVPLAMFDEEFDVVLFQAVVILERPEEPAAGQLIGEFVATICRGDLLQDRIDSQWKVDPPRPCQHGHRQKVIFPLAALELGRWNANAFTEAKEKSSMSGHPPRCPLELLVTHVGLNNFDELLVNLRIVDP